MACKLEILENLEREVAEKAEGLSSANWKLAQSEAKRINDSYEFDVVSVSEGENDYTNKITVHIPTALVEKYHAYFTALERKEAAGVQQEDAERAGEDFTDDYLFQKGEMPSSKASPETLNKIKEVAKRIGINIQDLLEYSKHNPDIDISDINGVADLTRNTIAVAQGMEDVTLTEEVVHFATAILDQTNPKLVTELISKIDRFKIYKQVLNLYEGNKDYQINGKPNIRKIKKEAVDKLLVEVIINNSENKTEFPELLEEQNISMVQKWWNTILDYLKGVYRKTNIDIFNLAGEQILNKDLGTAENLEGVFYQIKNDKVDAIYDTIVNKDSRMELYPDSPTDTRHYTFDGKRVLKSVTDKIKEEAKKWFGDISPEQQAIYDQYKDWGTDGHSLLENYISLNLIDKDGYKKPFTDVAISSKLDPRIQEQIKTFARELINSYKEGTRFVVERKVINEKEKGMLASTIDFMAIEPDEKTGAKVDILDWKFSKIDKSTNEDIPWYKQKEWKKQMGEYSKIMYQYGIKSDQLRKTRMMPFILNYASKRTQNGWSFTPESIEIGKLDNAQETKLYLLPVVLNTESTGSKDVDKLIKSLDYYYEKLYKTPVNPEDKAIKNIRLNELSKAIRSLHVKLDFAPLSNVGKTFLISANEAFKALENVDYSKLTKEEIINKLGELLEFKKSAEKFVDLDKTFLSAYPKDELTKESKDILVQLELVSSSTGRMMNKIIALQQEYVVQLALKEGMTSEENKETVLSPEKEVRGLFKSLTEASRIPVKLVQLATNLILNKRSEVNMATNSLMDEFGKILIPLENLAKRQGKSAFDLIGKATNSKLTLIKKLDKAFIEQIANEKLAGNKQFFIDNMDLEEYKKLSGALIEKITKEINATQLSSSEEEDAKKKAYRITELKDSLDIERPTFNGYTDYNFNRLFRQTLKEEKHYSAEYKQMASQKEALDMWNFLTALNERAKQAGYLDREGMSFFPLIEATMLQKLAATTNLLSETGELFKDLYTMRINEENALSKTDPETGQPTKTIPKLFTRTDKQVHQLSRDLTNVGTLWIKSLLEYEAAREMENTLLTMLSVEQAKGHLLMNDKQELIWEHGELKVDEKSNKNADILQTIIDDSIYGIKENLSSIGNIGLSTVTEKIYGNVEKAEMKAISFKKLLENMNKLTQSLAVGLKYTVAIPNYFGNHFQSFINNGGMYKYADYIKNHIKLITGIGLSTEEKGLLDMFVPLNGDLYSEKRRELALKQGYIKWLGAWNMQEAMMSSNYLPERNLQFTNALSHIENAMVRDGKIVNIRQYLKSQERDRYKTMSESERKSFEKGFDQRVKELKEKESLAKIVKIEGDKLVIPGVDTAELAKFRTKMVEWGRNLNGQMSQENRADYRRDTLLKSMSMFRNWIPKQISVRAHDITKNLEIGEWEYGRTRAFMKAYIQACHGNIFRMRDIMNGTDKGIALLDEMLQQKKDDYYRKNGVELEITNEEFYDMMRQALSNEMKELGTLLTLMTVVLGAKAMAPDPDDDRLTKNKYNYFLKLIHKISDEISFYYNPLSFVSMTKGNFLPALGTLVNVQKALKALTNETYGYLTDDEELMKKSQPIKYFLNVIPVISQFEKEWLPLIAPDLAKDMGIIVNPQPRPQQ